MVHWQSARAKKFVIKKISLAKSFAVRAEIKFLDVTGWLGIDSYVCDQI